ncbi:MAG: DUF6118 family protein [Aliidongia sp.]
MNEAGDDEEQAARAFEALCSELATQGQKLDLLCRLAQEGRAPDYSPTLDDMANTLQGMKARLAAIEGTPALTLTPAIYRDEIEGVVRLATATARDTMGRAVEAQTAAVADLQKTVGRVYEGRDQRYLLIFMGAVSMVVAIMLWCALVATLPWGMGTWLAAFPLTGGDRWEAGWILMRAEYPEVFDRMAKLSNTCGDRTVDVCIAALAPHPAEPPAPENKSPPPAARPKSR